MRRGSSFTVIVVFLSLTLAGLALIPKLPLRLNPSRALPGFTVSYNMVGASSRIMEQEMTSYLESMLSRMKGVESISSESGEDYGSINVNLTRGSDLEMARFEASTIIRQAWPSMPDGVSYPSISMKMPDEESEGPFMAYTLNASMTPSSIQLYAQENILPMLSRLEGVYKVDITGATPMVWVLRYDDAILKEYGVTITDISQAVQSVYGEHFLGIQDVDGTGERRMRLSIAPGIKEGDFDAGSIVLASSGSRVLRLSDIVSVSHEPEEPTGYFRINGLNSIYITVTSIKDANQLFLGRQVHESLSNLDLPSGMSLIKIYDNTESISMELETIAYRTLLTLLILLLFVLIMTRSLRYLFLIVCSLTVSLSISVIFYYLLGLEMQLYSLAGITISLNLIIDSAIVVSDHLIKRHNLKAYLSILAATLTTAGALVIVFFLDEELRLSLQDFAYVVIVNLLVALLIALFFVPAMVEKLGLEKGRSSGSASQPPMSIIPSRQRLAVMGSHLYERIIRALIPLRWLAMLLLVLCFGIPLFLLPEKVEGDGLMADMYNRTLGSDKYTRDIRPIVDKWFGGTLRLFVKDVYEGSYLGRQDETTLRIQVNMPNGSSLSQMDNQVRQMEAFISTYEGVRQFQTTISSAQLADISVVFTREAERSGFPYELKSDVTQKALRIGGGSWAVYGLQDQSFNNDARDLTGGLRIRMYGYNYDELYGWAERLKEQLLKRQRISDVTISSEFSLYKDDNSEFLLTPDRPLLALRNIAPMALYSESLRPALGSNIPVAYVQTGHGAERVVLTSGRAKEQDVWSFSHSLNTLRNDESYYRISDAMELEEEPVPDKIVKENQQYVLCLSANYTGSGDAGKRALNEDMKSFVPQLPMGYTAEIVDPNHWSSDQNREYLLLFVVIAIIFVTTGVLFNSLRQPFSILLLIPVSFIGVFLTFWYFNLNFDQGGFASFVLLCGVTVNSGIYILNEYNNIRKSHPGLDPVRSYVKAWNAKIMPVFLTMTSTILGFIPSLTGEEKTAFWFPLAAGTIGGLIISIIAIVILLPAFSMASESVS